MTHHRSVARCSAAVAVANVADARWMPHFDLAGLVLSSEAVVHATRVSTRSRATYQRLETFRVTRSVAGSLRVGDTGEGARGAGSERAAGGAPVAARPGAGHGRADARIDSGRVLS